MISLPRHPFGPLMRIAFGLALVLATATSGSAQSEEKGSSLGDLLNKVKDLKVPESVSNLPNQLTELKESYLETAKAVDDLRLEVAALREEVEALKSENDELRDAVGTKVASNDRSELLKAKEVSASELTKAYQTDREAASKEYGQRYLRVVGVIEGFETGVQEIIVLLKTDSDTRVRCHIKRDASFHAEVLSTQGRLVNRNDRSTLLSIGQPASILGTCAGMDLDLKMENCRIEGISAQRKD